MRTLIEQLQVKQPMSSCRCPMASDWDGGAVSVAINGGGAHIHGSGRGATTIGHQ